MKNSRARRTKCARAIDWLRDCADLAGVDPDSLESLAAGCRAFLAAGRPACCSKSGSNPDGVYLVASGRLGVKTPAQARPDRRDRARRAGRRGRLAAWKQQRSATVVALRDSELLLLPNAELDRIAAQSTHFSLALARLCARRLRHSNRQEYRPKRARVFAIVPNSIEVDVADLATRLVDELEQEPAAPSWCGMRAPPRIRPTWFNRIEEVNDYVVYVANSGRLGLDPAVLPPGRRDSDWRHRPAAV